METTAASTANTTAGQCGVTTTQYDPSVPVTARAPWVCPKCGRANAPWVDSCPCVATPPVAVPVPYPAPYPYPWTPPMPQYEPYYWRGPFFVTCQAAT